MPLVNSISRTCILLAAHTCSLFVDTTISVSHLTIENNIMSWTQGVDVVHGEESARRLHLHSCLGVHDSERFLNASVRREADSFRSGNPVQQPARRSPHHPNGQSVVRNHRFVSLQLLFVLRPTPFGAPFSETWGWFGQSGCNP